MQKSYMAKEKTLQKQWYVIDASKNVLGRMAVDIATVLMGKHHPWYTPHIDSGDFVIVINADKIKVTGKKRENRIYATWSGYPSGRKTKTMDEMLHRCPERVINLAVRRMLPKSRLGRKMLKKIKIYRGAEHPHQAQCPKEWKKQEALTLKEVLIHE